MKRINFVHLRDFPIDSERLMALSIEKEVSDSTKNARMYIWQCIYEGECEFPHFPERLTIELTNSFELTHSEENDSLTNRRSPVSFRWEQKKTRDAENRALSAYLHQAKQEKRRIHANKYFFPIHLLLCVNTSKDKYNENIHLLPFTSKEISLLLSIAEFNIS